MARSFNGSTDIIMVAAGLLTNINPPFFVSAWINLADTAHAYSVCGQWSGGGRYLLQQNSPTTVLGAINISGTNFTATQSGVSANTWLQVAMSVDASNNLVAYLGGSAGTPRACGAGALTAVGGNFEIGGDGGGNTYKGSIADIAIWTTVLSSAEVYALSKGIRPGNIRPSALLAWYPLDGYNHPALDRIRGKNGVLTGTTFVPGPPLISAAPIFVPQNIKSASAASSTVFRRTLSSLGTRTGSRQAVGF